MRNRLFFQGDFFGFSEIGTPEILIYRENGDDHQTKKYFLPIALCRGTEKREFVTELS